MLLLHICLSEVITTCCAVASHLSLTFLLWGTCSQNKGQPGSINIRSSLCCYLGNSFTDSQPLQEVKNNTGTSLHSIASLLLVHSFMLKFYVLLWGRNQLLYTHTTCDGYRRAVSWQQAWYYMPGYHRTGEAARRFFLFQR